MRELSGRGGCLDAMVQIVKLGRLGIKTTVIEHGMPDFREIIPLSNKSSPEVQVYRTGVPIQGRIGTEAKREIVVNRTD